MDEEKTIGELFNILVQYEKISDPSSNVTERTYRSYLNRLYIWYIGYGIEEIATHIKGLYKLGSSAQHDSVKRSVFHMISILKKKLEDDNNAL